MKGRAIVRADGGFQAAICMSGSVEAESMACSAVVSCLPYSLALAACTFDRGRAETGAQNKGTYWVAGPARLVDFAYQAVIAEEAKMPTHPSGELLFRSTGAPVCGAEFLT